MKKLLIAIISVLFSLSIGVPSSHAVDFDMLAATPVGSWQVREDIETNAKGKQSGITMRTSMLGTEERNGEMHYWIEASMSSFKISKKGKRKPRGKTMVIKALIAESVFKSDAENILGNLNGLGEETIIQTGNEKPMRIRDSGGMMAGMMNAFGAQITHDYSAQGSESVSVPAGEFEAQKISGSGTVEMKVIFKKIHVESDSTVWISDKVPFGAVRGETTSVTNGKASTTSSQLLEFGKSGAVSLITQEPEDMPDMPNMTELFN